jgi:hypothetical protein
MNTCVDDWMEERIDEWLVNPTIAQVVGMQLIMDDN